MDNQHTEIESTTGKHPRSVNPPVLNTHHAPQSVSVAAFSGCNPEISHPQPQLHQEFKGSSQSFENHPGHRFNSKQSLFLTGVPERKFGAEPIYPTYPLPPFVSPAKLGAPPMSPTAAVFGQSPTSMIETKGSFGEQMDALLSVINAQQAYEDYIDETIVGAVRRAGC